MELWLTVNGKRTCASAPLDPLTRAVVISLFTWRRAEPDDNADVPMGWWGDAAPSLTRVHQRADALMRELDPRTTTELINRWERLCGLPDECIPAGTQTLRQRQQRLDAKVNLAGGINEDFYLAQLAALGRPDATITRYDKSTFTCSSACTDAVNAPEWRYYWQVNMPAATNTTWMTCGDPCDSALRIWGDTVVECVLNKLCPSHTYVIFKYPE